MTTLTDEENWVLNAVRDHLAIHGRRGHIVPLASVFPADEYPQADTMRQIVRNLHATRVLADSGIILRDDCLSEGRADA